MFNNNDRINGYSIFMLNEERYINTYGESSGLSRVLNGFVWCNENNLIGVKMPHRFKRKL